MFKQILNALAVALATAFFIALSLFVLFCVEVHPDGTASITFRYITQYVK